MRSPSTAIRCVVQLALAHVAVASLAMDQSQGAESAARQRVPWTTSRVRGTPDPPPRYRTEIAFPELKWDEPLAIARIPNSSRLCVVERYGRLYTLDGDGSAAEASVLLDLNAVLGRTALKSLAAYGAAFHPDFPRSRFVYVTYVPHPADNMANGTRLSRFRTFPDEPFRCDPTSETVLLDWKSGGHNAACLAFGPDGYLYIGTGDGSGIADGLLTGQDLSDLSASILRIDVDRTQRGLSYAIPPDNPFVDLPGARPEIWAYGMRQPWAMSFDPVTHDLWCGNVGQDLWEQIYRIERGGNYGWSVTEGSHPFRPERQRSPTPILPPVVEHDHAAFRSITGGVVYRGAKLPELAEAYIYGDYDTGKIWMFRYDQARRQAIDHQELVDSNLRILGIVESPAGDLLLLDHVSGKISRLVPNVAADGSGEFPRRLSETGLFSSVAHHEPAPGLLSYSVAAPQWCDSANKQRYMALPDMSQIAFEAIVYPGAHGAPLGWKFPDGTVLMETLSLQMDADDPRSSRRLETRILHHERTSGSEEIGDQVWQAYAYVWNDEQTDAILLEEPAGRDRTFVIRDATARNGERRQTWHFPGRTECIVCHNMAAKYALGVQTLQMNQSVDYGHEAINQLEALEQLGVFEKPLPQRPSELSQLADYRDPQQGLERRALSYVHANCSHCHRKWGGGNAEFQLLATLDLPELQIAGIRPAHGAFDLLDARLLAPGDPYRSVIFYRMAKLGPGRMPRLGSNVVDPLGAALIHDWIAQLTPPDEDASAALIHARDAAGKTWERLEQDAGADELVDALRPALSTTNTALQLAWKTAAPSMPQARREQIAAFIGREAHPHVRDLFERYLPEEDRTQRLGNVVDATAILSLAGDVDRGRTLFLEGAGVQCRSCHRVQGQGVEVGPDLSQIGKKRGREELLQSILQPSLKIDPAFLVYVVETKDGRLHSGLLAERTEAQIILKTAENKLVTLTADDVERIVPQQTSLMPELLVRDLTAQQVADLTEFLAALQPQ